MGLERHPPRYPGEPAVLEVADDGLIFYVEAVADSVARLVHVETPGGRDLPARDYDVERLPRGVRTALAREGIEQVVSAGRFGAAARTNLAGEQRPATRDTMIDEDLADAIVEIVDDRYAASDGIRPMRVGMLQAVLDEGYDIEVSRNEVEVACDQLVAADRLVFVGDSGKAGRRYCSTDADAGRVERLKHISG